MPGHQAALRVDHATDDGVALPVNSTTQGSGINSIKLLDILRAYEPRPVKALVGNNIAKRRFEVAGILF